MPYQIPEFLALLAEADREAAGNRFLEVGAGTGTKMLLAREIFGLDVAGIEISGEYAAQAAAIGLPVVVCDAADYAGYGDADLIWLYRPCRDPDAEAALEKVIWDQMIPGAVVFGAALETLPPGGSFWPVLEDLDARRGIWRKVR